VSVDAGAHIDAPQAFLERLVVERHYRASSSAVTMRPARRANAPLRSDRASCLALLDIDGRGIDDNERARAAAIIVELAAVELAGTARRFRG